MNELLTCEGLTKSYQKGTNALDNIELHIGFGRIVGLLGPNGSGKTTLIKLANGLLQPTAGSIRIAGMDPGPDTKAIVSYLPFFRNTASSSTGSTSSMRWVEMMTEASRL